MYNAVDKAPVVALGTQHGILTSAYGELRVSCVHERSSSHELLVAFFVLIIFLRLLSRRSHPTRSCFRYSSLFSSQPITSSPNGPADIIGKQITDRLSKDYGKEVTYAQMIFSWLKSTGVVAVT